MGNTRSDINLLHELYSSHYYRLKIWEDAVGPLLDLREEDGWCIARIGPVDVLLPIEMKARLNGLIGSRIGVIHCDNGYKFRIIKSRNEE